jgi:hypothetical protein
MYKLIDSPVYTRYHLPIIRHLITTRAMESSNISELSIIYALLLHAGREDLTVMKVIVQTSVNAQGVNHFLKKLCDEIEYCVGGTRFTTILLMLTFEMCKVAKLSKQDLGRCFNCKQSGGQKAIARAGTVEKQYTYLYD